MPALPSPAYNYNSGWGYGWYLAILPSVEQSVLFNAYNFAGKSNGPENSTTGYAQVNTFLCPSDEAVKTPQYPWAASNYFANLGGPGIIQRFTGGIVPTGSWINHVNVGTITFASIRDGSSNTAMFSEKLLGVYANSPLPLLASSNGLRGFFDLSGGATADQINTNPTGAGAAAQSFLNMCKAVPGTTQAGNSECFGYIGVMGYYVHGTDCYNHFGTPNTTSCHNKTQESTQVWEISAGISPPTSRHPGGVNLCTGDGSVKFIKDSVAIPTWWALGTRNGGEVISSDSY